MLHYSCCKARSSSYHCFHLDFLHYLMCITILLFIAVLLYSSSNIQQRNDSVFYRRCMFYGMLDSFPLSVFFRKICNLLSLGNVDKAFLFTSTFYLIFRPDNHFCFIPILIIMLFLIQDSLEDL